MATVPFVTIAGKDIPMPPGVILTSVISEPPPPAFEPTEFGMGDDVLYYRDSWVRFRGDVLLDSHVEPEDSEALAPLLNELNPE
jgi:hypothetical protein